MDSILVADADVSAVETVAHAAAEAGLEVIIAENGIEALERFRQEVPRFLYRGASKRSAHHYAERLHPL